MSIQMKPATRRAYLEGQALACQRNVAQAYKIRKQFQTDYWQRAQRWWASEAMRFLDLLINGEDN